MFTGQKAALVNEFGNAEAAQYVIAGHLALDFFDYVLAAFTAFSRRLDCFVISLLPLVRRDYHHAGHIIVNLHIVPVRRDAEIGNDFLSPFGDDLVVLQDVLGRSQEAVEVFPA